jgi:hypothetical protein
VLQGVADAYYKCIAVKLKGAGRQSDGGIFVASTLYQLLEGNKFNVPDAQYLPN